MGNTAVKLPGNNNQQSATMGYTVFLTSDNTYEARFMKTEEPARVPNGSHALCQHLSRDTQTLGKEIQGCRAQWVEPWVASLALGKPSSVAEAWNPVLRCRWEDSLKDLSYTANLRPV